MNERCFLSFCVSAVSGAVGFAVLQPAGRWWAGGSRSGVHNGGRFCGPCSGGAGGSKNLESIVHNNSERQLFYLSELSLE